MTNLPFDTGEGPARYRVLAGENDDPARRGDKSLIARSECALTCPNLTVVEKTIKALQASGAELRNRPASERFYDWTSTFLEFDPARPENVRILFGVAWYDEAFFAENFGAFGNGAPTHMFDHLGIAAEAIEVTHWREVQLAA